MIITPAILETDPEELKRKVSLIESGTDLLQIDVGDGKFIPTVTVLPRALDDFRPLTAFEVHLMVQRPDRFIADWAHLGATKAIFHIEAEGDVERFIAQCRDLDCDVGVALNPGTSMEDVQPYLDLVDEVMFMGVTPGAQGNPYNPEVEKAIAEFHQAFPAMPLAIDGGVTEKNLTTLHNLGVMRACVGSALWMSANPIVTLEKLRLL